MATITLIAALFVVLAALAIYYNWSTNTVEMAQQAIILQYTQYTSNDEEYYIHISGHKHSMNCESLPTHSNHLFPLATNGEWGKIGHTHHSKGITIHSYRTGDNRSYHCSHPCMCGDDKTFD